jgi:GntR family transcriptional regulator / MocR family aminotransferase
MARTQGPAELLIAIDRHDPEPLRDQVAGQIRGAIRAGRLRAGVRLPATRRLAADLGVSRGVVVEAYGELAHQGFILGSGRASPRVASGAAAPGAQATAPLPAAPAPSPSRSYRFDLAPEVPDMALFPRREWLRALRFALDTAPDQTLDYGDPRGALELREALADYLGRARGVVTDPGCIVVCQGSIQAIDLACRTLAAAGARRMGVEDPCADGIRHACRYAGLTMAPTSVDRRGVSVEELAAAGLDAAIVSPVHQFPTGAALHPERRRRLLAWAVAAGVALIEDDYDAEFCYEGRAAAALQGSAAEHVIHVGSVSKALAPAIRLGWAVFPRRLVGSAGELKAALDGGSPAVEQIALAQMIGRSVYENHVRRVRVEYGRRRAAALQALARRLPANPVSGAGGGLHFAVALDEPVDRADVEARADARRIRLRAMESFLARRPDRASTLLLGYARLPVAAAEPAVDALAELLSAA